MSVEAKNSSLFRHWYPARPVGCGQVHALSYSGSGCRYLRHDVSWTLCVTCGLLSVSVFPAHTIVCRGFQHLSSVTVQSYWQSCWLKYGISTSNGTSAVVTQSVSVLLRRPYYTMDGSWHWECRLGVVGGM